MVMAWLLGAGLGPAAVALPVTWAANVLAGAARRWFSRLCRTDDLSRLVRAATGSREDLTSAEFDAVRRLLEDQQTWVLLGQGTVEDLASEIASCLPPRDGRTAADSQAAALTIARGLLEFAVADLDPKLFQQLLLRRLDRLATDQASALDTALLGLHADLMARFTDVTEQLKRIVGRLPPGPAHWGEITLYLQALIDWLSTDPWPRDPRFDGPVLAPAGIERKLRITARGGTGGQDLDADDLARRCERLVVLGGPGAGKTWLAKRTARRCAEEALAALAAGRTLDEVELPLYTTCSSLFSAAGDIRDAAVSSALGQLGDLGGSRVSAALQVFFTERNAPTLLVVDSLDEARGPGQRLRLRQAGTLPWRIVLTSRPSSWRNQLVIDKTSQSHEIGEIQPLRYPDDVEPFLQRWFAARPERVTDLTAEIARPRALQQALGVPLILAFYCIIAGRDPLPEFRRDLFARVLSRMLTGSWHDDGALEPDPGTCLRVLRAWAWAGAASNPVSGVGTWADEISTERISLGEADQAALDHVAAPIALPSLDTGRTARRFVHRSIREYLVAEHVAGLPLDQAVEALLPHLWYDPDWEYSAAAAIAGHPERDQLLRSLIYRAAQSHQIPEDLSVIDATREFRRLLARVAAESHPDDWTAEVAGVIGRARVELAAADLYDHLGEAGAWVTSNRRARDRVLGLMASGYYDRSAVDLTSALVQLAPAADDRRQARERLLGLLADESSGFRAARLADAIARLGPTASEKLQGRRRLLGLLDSLAGGADAGDLAAAIARLDPTTEDRRHAREVLLGLLASQASVWAASARHMGGKMGQLASWLTAELVAKTTELAVTADDASHTRQALLAMLAGQASGLVAARLADGVTQLGPPDDEKRRACHKLVELLTSDADGWESVELARAVARLGPTPSEKRQACQKLLELLASEPDADIAVMLASALVQLDPAGDDLRQLRETLFQLLASPVGIRRAHQLTGRVVQLATSPESKQHARQELFRLLADPPDSDVTAALAAGVIQLASSQDDKRQARRVLLELLRARQADRGIAAASAAGLAQLDPTVEDTRQARDALGRWLAQETDGSLAASLANAISRLGPTAEDQRQASEAILRLLPGETSFWTVRELLRELVQLVPTTAHRRHAREAVLALLATQTDRGVAGELQTALEQLDPTARDLAGCRGWAAPPFPDLLAAVRRNSGLPEWLAILPSLATLAGSAPSDTAPGTQ
jgi:hypothetical protein